VQKVKARVAIKSALKIRTVCLFSAEILLGEMVFPAPWAGDDNDLFFRLMIVQPPRDLLCDRPRLPSPTTCRSIRQTGMTPITLLVRKTLSAGQ